MQTGQCMFTAKCTAVSTLHIMNNNNNSATLSAGYSAVSTCISDRTMQELITLTPLSERGNGTKGCIAAI